MFESLFSRSGLSLDRLRVLCEVADAGGIARATPNDPTRQSQFSRQLKELEDFFQVELTRRQGKGIALTQEGKELATRSRELLQSLEDFQVQWMHKPLTYSIGAGESLLEWVVLPNLAKCVERHSQANFRLLNLRTVEIVTRLQDLRIDFGLIREDALRSPLEAHPLGQLEYALYCPKQLCRKRMSATYLEDILAKVPLALLDSSGDFARDLKSWLAENQVPISPRLACDSLPMAFRALQTGQYATILPTIAVPETLKSDFLKYPLPQKMGVRNICLAWNPRTIRLRDQTHKVAEFLKAAFTI